MSSHPQDSSQSTPEGRGADAEGWERRERLNKSEAERLLDWLEANGYSQREATLAEDGSFTVRWRR
ncbi:MAG TPA: hypothetical protein VH592_07980 [Gemmataceae bacterium]|jgi:hypothetical protein